jgi:hypothetical protein
MHRQSVCAAIVLFVASVATGACGGDSSTAAALTAPTAAATTDVFAGTVAVGGSDSHPFTVSSGGSQLNVILTAASPPATIFMGVAVGTPSGSTCTPLTNGSVVTPAGSTAQLSGTVSAGSYCVMVYDVGNQTVDVTYSVTVSHF